MVEFTKGSLLYTKDGGKVYFDHAVGSMAYVRPMVRTLVQVYQGSENFDEDEDYEPAGYLTEVPVEFLLEYTPAELFDQHVTETKQELSQLQQQLKQAEKALLAFKKDTDTAATQRQQELDEWRKTYPVFEDTMRFLEGLPVYTLNIRQHDSYHGKKVEMPTIPSDKDIEFFSISPKLTKGDRVLSWKAVRRVQGSYREYKETLCEFFPSEKARMDKISEMFSLALDQFRKNPDYNERNEYSSKQLFGNLVHWTAQYPNLTIPEDILEGKKQHDTQQAAKKRDALLQQLDALATAITPENL